MLICVCCVILLNQLCKGQITITGDAYIHGMDQVNFVHNVEDNESDRNKDPKIQPKLSQLEKNVSNKKSIIKRQKPQYRIEKPPHLFYNCLPSEEQVFTSNFYKWPFTHTENHFINFPPPQSIPLLKNKIYRTGSALVADNPCFKIYLTKNQNKAPPYC